MHYRGEDGPINFAEARRLLASAVLQGQADAQVLLGEMHFRGEGGEVDMGKARRLLELAAARGHEKAPPLTPNHLTPCPNPNP